MLSSRKAGRARSRGAGRSTARSRGSAANAGEPDQADACVAATMERFGALDILVNNAATNPYMGPTIDIDLPRLDKTDRGELAGAALLVPARVAARRCRSTAA